ncbi:MAG: CobW family GTP-binding protein [Candidatus Woesearchaeota archaeon]
MENTTASQKKVPVTLITGFLGSGKSTLINTIIKQHNTIKFGVILNEFGDVKLESTIIETSDENIVEFSNGCMCCVMNDDIIGAIDTLIEKNIEYILIEASGLSMPLPIARTILYRDLQGKVHFDGIVCVVDMLHFCEHAQDFALTFQQLRTADIIVLSKKDQVSQDTQKQVKKLIADVNSEVPCVSMDAQSIALLIDTQPKAYTLKENLEYQHEPIEHVVVKGGVYKHDALVTFFESLPKDIIRAKGKLYFSDDMQHYYVFQMVGAKRALFAKPYDNKKESILVFIGKKVDKESIEQGCKACQVDV